MINKKEFDLLLQEIFQIENKIEELKTLNKFEIANEFEKNLENIKFKAKQIVLDDKNEINEFDEISLEVLSELIKLTSDIDFYILKINNVIESAIDNQIDVKVLEKLKNLWESLENDIKFWNKSKHNPIEEIENSKHIGKKTLNILLFQLENQAILDLSKALNYCKPEFLINAIKEILFEGAKNQSNDELKRNLIIKREKNLSEKDLYDYKLWQEILRIKDIKSRDDHIEIIGNIQEKKEVYDDNYIDENKIQKLDVFYEESFLDTIKKFISNVNEFLSQKKMAKKWTTNQGPAFKIEYNDENIKYVKEYLDNNLVENTKKLIIATNGISKYNFNKNAKWKNLESIEFLSKKNSSAIRLSPDKTYNCIGKDVFSDCIRLKEINFGKIQMIGENAFKNCISLSNVIFPENIINVGENAFEGCKNLTKVEFLGDLKLYILDRPQNIINCFRKTNVEQITFPSIETAFNFAIVDCPTLKEILVSKFPKITLPFKICKYRLGRQEGIVSFIGEKSLNLWKKKNSTIRFFELTDEDKKKYSI